MTADLDKLSPWDRDAERGLLGSILRDGRALHDEAAAIVQADDFYAYAHQVFWRAFGAMIDSGMPIDPVTLHAQLGAAIEAVGGERAIIELWDGAPSAVNAVRYAEIIRAKSLARQYLAAGKAISDAAVDPNASPEDIAALADRSLHAIQSRASDEPKTMKQAIADTMAEWEERRKADNEDAFAIQTPWPKFNHLTGGLKRRGLSILAARPSVGKTLTVLNILSHASDRGLRCFFASLEQSRTQIIQRFIGARAQIAGNKFRKAAFDPLDERKIVEATRHMEDNWPLLIDDEPIQTAGRIVAKCRQLVRRSGLDLVVVDYLGLIANDTDFDTEYAFLADMVRRLRGAAKTMNFHLMLLCQLNRNSEGRADPRPKLSDLRDSGKIEEHADEVFMLHRPGASDDSLLEQMIEIGILKQRNDPTGWITMVHAKRFFEIRELAG